MSHFNEPTVLPPFSDLFPEAPPSDHELQRMLDVAFDPNTPDPGADLIPDDNVDLSDLDNLEDLEEREDLGDEDLDSPAELDDLEQLHDSGYRVELDDLGKHNGLDSFDSTSALDDVAPDLGTEPGSGFADNDPLADF